MNQQPSRDRAMAQEIGRRVAALGGRAYYVGGCVRDRLMGRPCKDIDLEVHGVTVEQLRALLDEVGTCAERGASFGIFALAGYDLDIAMPRKEHAIGTGHKDFSVLVDPWIGTYQAAIRRDFTINALMEDVLTGEVIDQFGGQNDLTQGVLRHVKADTFVEDPLRVLRGAQFAARFGFTLADETVALMRTMDLASLSSERIMGELEKALLKADKPSTFFRELRAADQLDVWFSQVKDLIGVEQPTNYHPEGDVWNHTMLVIDAAAQLRSEATWPLAFMLAALCHDLGKPATTLEVNGRLHALGHEEVGVEVTDAFLHRITNEKKLIAYVKNMVALHMRPNLMAAQHSKPKSFNHLFDESVAPSDLLLLAKADYLGTTGLPADAYQETETFLRERLAWFKEVMAKPYVMGSDLIAAGLTPGPSFSQVLAYAHKLRLANIEKNDALRQTLAQARKL